MLNNELINQDQVLTLNPNLGGFGQIEVEIVLRNLVRIYGYAAFCLSIVLVQSKLIFQKKQFEKV